MKKIGFIGLGHMGQALLINLIKLGLSDKYQIYIYNRSLSKSLIIKKSYPELNICETVHDISKKVDIIISSVIAEAQGDVLKQIKNSGIHFISCSNGLKISEMKKVYKGRITRIMPTITLGGYTLITKDGKDLEDIFSSISETLYLDEDEFDLMTLITSCGPGLFSTILEQLTNSFSLKTTIEKETISKMISRTFLKTLYTIEHDSLELTNVINKVATKGGLTEVGVDILRKKLPDVLDLLIQESLNYNRNKTISLSLN